jgi:hypothetical protein
MEYNEYPRKQGGDYGPLDITRPVGEVFKNKAGEIFRVNKAIDNEDIEASCSNCCFEFRGTCGESKTRKKGTRGECRGFKRTDNIDVYYSNLTPVHINFMEE